MADDEDESGAADVLVDGAADDAGGRADVRTDEVEPQAASTIANVAIATRAAVRRRRSPALAFVDLLPTGGKLSDPEPPRRTAESGSRSLVN